MDHSSLEFKKRMEAFESRLRRAGTKLTHQRLEIFRELARSQEHPDAEEVYRAVRKRVPTISLDTVYRTLWMLLDLGLIDTLGAHRGRARFDANLELHHHFVCRRCGLTRDFHSSEFDGLEVPAAVKSFGSIDGTRVEVRGICLRCSSASKNRSATRFRL